MIHEIADFVQHKTIFPTVFFLAFSRRYLDFYPSGPYDNLGWKERTELWDIRVLSPE